jgi:hypothetical protein
MSNDHYIQDDGCEQCVNHEEMWIHFAIKDFEEVLDKYGSDFTLKKMGNAGFEILSEWFARAHNASEC